MEMREALTDENQTSNFVVSFATAVIKNSRNFFLQLCGFSCFFNRLMGVAATSASF